MTFLLMTKCIVAVLITMRGQLVGSCSNRVVDGKGDCCSNYYKDGDICKDCPAGYHGDNCTDMCSSNTYGVSCGRICSCTPCHHIYGCMYPAIKTEDCSEGYYGTNCTEVCPSPTFGHGCKQTCNCSSCHHKNGCYTTSDKAEPTTFNEQKDGTESTYTQGGNVITEKHIIIFIGSLISTALILAILWKTYKYRKIKTPARLKSSTDVIYEDIAV